MLQYPTKVQDPTNVQESAQDVLARIAAHHRRNIGLANAIEHLSSHEQRAEALCKLARTEWQRGSKEQAKDLLESGISVAKQVTSEERAGNLLIEIGKTFLEYRETEAALKVIGDMKHQGSRDEMRAAVTRYCIADGDLEYAARVAKSIEDNSRSSCLGEVVTAAVASGALEHALAVCADISSGGNFKDGLLQSIAAEYVKRGDYKNAFTVAFSVSNEDMAEKSAGLVLEDVFRNSAMDALQELDSFTNQSPLRARLWMEAARNQIKDGDTEAGRESLRSAVKTLLSGSYSKTAFLALVNEQLRSGFVDDALTQLDLVESEDIRTLCIDGIYKFLAEQREAQPLPVDYSAVEQELGTLAGESRRAVLLDLAVVAPAEVVRNALDAVAESDREPIAIAVNAEAAHNRSNFFRVQRQRIVKDTKQWLEQRADAAAAGVPCPPEEAAALVDTLRDAGGKDVQEFVLTFSRTLLRDVGVADLAQRNPLLMPLLDLLAEHNNLRGNELLIEALSEQGLGYGQSVHVLEKLVHNNYLEKEVLSWLTNHKDKERGLEALKELLMRSIVPSQLILEHIVDRAGAGESVRQVTRDLAKYHAEACATSNLDELLGTLCGSQQGMMGYYVTEAGRTRFDLINNYSFEKFKEVLKVANGLKVHEGTLQSFENLLTQNGRTKDEAKEIVAALRRGQHPLSHQTQGAMVREVALNGGRSKALEAAERELGEVFGRRQLGAWLKGLHYGGYLDGVTGMINSWKAGSSKRALIGAEGLKDRVPIITEIEKRYPEFVGTLERDVRVTWDRVLGGKLPVDLAQITRNPSNPVDGTRLLAAIERKRSQVLREKRDELELVRGKDLELEKVSRSLNQKRKALKSIERGLARNANLEPVAAEIRIEVATLEKRHERLSKADKQDSAAEVRDARRAAQLESEVEALKSKEPGKVFEILMKRAIGDAPLSPEAGFQLSEIASHFEGAVKIIEKELNAERERLEVTTKQIRVRLLEKKADLMTAVRFADSKICCFSSHQYDKVAAHSLPDKFWVASALKDPLSFVFLLEDAAYKESAQEVRKNIGFVMGMFGQTKQNELVLVLNGVYLSTGNDSESIASVTNAIEEMFARPLGVKHIIIGAMDGGRVSEIKGYEQSSLNVWRYRALMDNRENPEKRVYDDLGKEANTYHEYGARKDKNDWETRVFVKKLE